MNNINIANNKNNIIKGWDFSKDQILGAIRGPLHCLNPSIDLTNACNLNCPYCYIEDKNSLRKKRLPDEISYQQTLEVVDSFVALGAKTINIVGAGEPTIDQHFVEIVDYIASKGLISVVFTNGIKLSGNPALIEFLYNKNVSVVIKLNSFESEHQDLVAGRSGYTRKRNRVIQKLIQAGFNKSFPTRLGVDTILYQGNIKEMFEVHKWSRENNIFPITADYIPTGRTDQGVFESQNNRSLDFYNDSQRRKLATLLEPVAKEPKKQLLKNIQEFDARLGIIKNTNCAYYGGGICTQILGLYVDIKGDIYPCVARKKREGRSLSNGLLGNIAQDSLLDIWRQSSYMQGIREHYNGGCPYKAKLVN